jgi:hypothetical protein
MTGLILTQIFCVSARRPLTSEVFAAHFFRVMQPRMNSAQEP